MVFPEIPVCKKRVDMVVIVDHSGSTAEHAKIVAVNQSVPVLRDGLVQLAQENPGVEILVRVIGISGAEARWLVETATAVADLVVPTLSALGETPLGSAFKLLAGACRSLTGSNLVPPSFVLMTDGAPSGSWRPELADLFSTAWGAKSNRIAIALGPEAQEPGPQEVFREFVGPEGRILSVADAVNLPAMIRLASTIVVRQSIAV